MSDAPERIPGLSSPDEHRVATLRVWPAIGLLLLIGVLWLTPKIAGSDRQDLMFLCFMGRLGAGLLLLVWWLLLSRATLIERLAGLVGVLVIAGVTFVMIDPTLHIPGFMLVSVPVGLTTFGLVAVACGTWQSRKRAAWMLAATACAFGSTLLLRNEGMWSDGALTLGWRWAPSAEEARLADGDNALAAEDVQPLGASAAENLVSPAWPEFRGPGRLGVQHGTTLNPDWDGNPPEELWRIPVGPAWSSFVVAGELLYTQEQRGDEEAVCCYSAKNGQLHWITTVQARFADPLGGPGPRSTPTLAGDALYVMGAAGDVLRLNALTGDVVWRQDLRELAEREPPSWGFASSPLVMDDVVIVHAGGSEDLGVFALESGSGSVRWSAPSGDHTYSSPQPAEIDGEKLALILTNTGLSAIGVATGQVRLDYRWEHNGYRALQPQPMGGGAYLLPSGTGTGTRQIALHAGDETLGAEDGWSATNFRPDFNDCVLHDGFAYGFDGGRFVCFDLKTGERKWRGGNYGKGQVLLLADAGQLLVTTEKGEIALVEAKPEAANELARFRAFEGKTWNHPVLVGDRLYVRNAEEAACYRLATVG